MRVELRAVVHKNGEDQLARTKRADRSQVERCSLGRFELEVTSAHALTLPAWRRVLVELASADSLALPGALADATLLATLLRAVFFTSLI